VGQNGTFHFTVNRDLLDNSQTKILTVSQFRRLVNTLTRWVLHCSIRALNSGKYFTENRDYVIALKQFVKTRCQRFDYSTNYAVRELTKYELVRGELSR